MKFTLGLIFPMNSKSLLFTAALLAALPAAAAVFVTETYNFNVGSTAGDIPDGGGSSTFSQFLSASQILNLTEVQVGLNLTGNPAGQGWAGDMFVSLNRNLGSQTAILLNQVGVTGGNLAGFGHDGWNVTLKDSATANGDIHLGQPTGPATTLSGSWQPDGRLSPTDLARPAVLGVFNGTSANTLWHLYVADLSPGGTLSLNSWSLTLTGITAVPEPETYALFAGAALLGFAAWRKRA